MEFENNNEKSISRKDKILEALKGMSYDKLENLSKKFSEIKDIEVN